MSEITFIGVDLAKTIFRINGVDEHGKRVVNKNVHRDSMIPFFATLPECTVAMESCASSHYWGRTIESMGHTVRLIHPRYVAPYRLGDKNDANDAAAICAAAQRPDMRFVRIKSRNQMDIQALHRVREGLVKEKTATLNRARGLLAENGFVYKKGIASALTLLPDIIADADNELSGVMRRVLLSQYEHLLHLREQIAELEAILKNLAAEEEDCRRLMRVPGIGLITSTLLLSEVGNGRALAAYLGLVPAQHSSGGKSKLLGISKKGNEYLRTLLIHCARSVLRAMAYGHHPFGNNAVEQWVRELLERRGKCKTAVALAAKLARIAWRLLARGEEFKTAVVAA